jgi:hypothetical protein
MMKRVLFWTLFLTFSLCASAFAQNVTSVTALGSSSVSGQVACGTSPTLLYSTTQSGGAQPFGRLSITFELQGTQPVYIAPRPDISTSNAGFLLITQGHAMTFDRSSGNVSWYCITTTGSAVVGFTEEK